MEYSSGEKTFLLQKGKSYKLGPRDFPFTDVRTFLTVIFMSHLNK